MANRWTPLGPSAILVHRFDDGMLPPELPIENGAGEVTCILPEPGGRMLVGTAGGGVWRHADGRWQALTDGAPALAIGALARDPANSQRLYAAAGVHGHSHTMFSPRGVIVSQDGGQTWSLALLPKAITEPRALLPVANGVAFLVALEGVFLTIDGGAQWTLFDAVGGDSATIAHEFGSSIPWILLCRGPKLFRGDGVTAFQQVIEFSPGDVFSLAAAPGDRSMVHALGASSFSMGAYVRSLFQSQNGGRDWTQVVNIVGDLPTDHPLKAFSGEVTSLPIPIAATGDDLSLLRVGIKHVWNVSIPANLTDGVTATPLEHEHDPQTDEDRMPRLYPRALADVSLDLYVAAGGGLWRWDDIAQPHLWVPINRGRGAAELIKGAVDMQQDGVVAAVSITDQTWFGTPIFSKAHPVWRRIDGALAGARVTETVTDIGIRGAAREWVAAHASSLAIAHGFTLLEDSVSDSDWMRLAVSFAEPSVVYFGGKSLHRMDGDAHKPLVEFDAANSAQEQIRTMAVAPGSSDVVWVALDGKVVRGDVATKTFDSVSLPSRPAPGVPVSALAVSPASTDRVYVGFGEDASTLDAQPTTRLLRKASASDAWEDLTANLPDTMPIRAIVIDPAGSTDPAQERIVVAGDQGIFDSRGGAPWQRITGLPEIAVAGLQLDPTTSVLRAFTVGRGAWELDPHATKSVALHLRAHGVDAGRRPLPAVAPPNPFAIGGGTLGWSDGAAIKVDVVDAKNAMSDPSFQTSSATIDFVDFVKIGHRPPRAKDAARVFVEVLDRAPDAARDVTVRVYWAKRSGAGWPDLPAGFWAAFPGDPPAGMWKPIGPAKSIAEVRPALPEIASWEWNVPADAAGDIGLLAIVTCADDAIAEPMPLAIEALVRADARVALRPTAVTKGPKESHTLRTILEIAAGVLAIAGAYYAYEHRDDIWATLEEL